SGNGGAVDNEGPGTTMTLIGSTFRDNRSAGVDGDPNIPVRFGNAEGLGGALMNYAESTCCVIGCNFSDNLSIATTTGSVGGGIANVFATLTVSSSTFQGNQAIGEAFEGLGGAILNDGGPLLVTDSTFLHNEALGAAGSYGIGGAIENNAVDGSTSTAT